MVRKKSDGLPPKFEDIDLGPITAKKLRDAGANGALDVIIMGPEEISIETGMKREDADKIFDKALTSLSESGKLPKLKTTMDVLNFQKDVKHLKAGCKALDDMLRGGVETKSLTEVYGMEGAGKTQWVLSLCVETLLSGHGVAVIDCENTFDLDRLQEIAEARGTPLTEDHINKIHLEVTPDTYLIRKAIQNMPKLIEENGIKLILVDGIVGKYRMEYDQGRGVLSDRQNHIKYPIRRLSNIALYQDVAVVFTNQVTANPDGQYSGESDKAIGGHIFGHSVKYILKFNKGAANKRVAHFKKSNKDPQFSVEFYLTAAGVTDPENVNKDGVYKKPVKIPEFNESEVKDTSLLLEN
jgi:DNA repair protein RadA